MGSNLNVFDDRAIQTIVQTVREQALEIQNLQRQLRALGVQRHEAGIYIPMQRARLTSVLDDDNLVADANKWSLDLATGEYYETNQAIKLRSFLRPSGESIAERTRVYYTLVGNVNECVVVNCDADPEDEEETP